jgi:hypothetical protein
MERIERQVWRKPRAMTRNEVMVKAIARELTLLADFVYEETYTGMSGGYAEARRLVAAENDYKERQN